MKSKNLVVVKHNDLIESSYALSIYENRILLTCISKINSVNKISVDDVFSISGEDLKDLVPYGQSNVYNYLEKATKRLYNRSIEIKLSDRERFSLRWVSYVKYIPNEGTVELQFSQKIIPFISELSRNFTKYKLNNVMLFKSNYSIRFYELFMKWKGTDKTLEVDWIKKQFQLEDKYQYIGDLKKRIIDVAVKEINAYSDLNVSYTQIKRGRNVVAFKFEYADKTPKRIKPKQVTAPTYHTPNKGHLGFTMKEIEAYTNKVYPIGTGKLYEEIAHEMLTKQKEERGCG